VPDNIHLLQGETMFPLLEPISAAIKAVYAAQFTAMAALTKTAVEGAAKAASLNLDTMKDSLAESANASQQMMSAVTPQEWLLLRSAQVRPTVERAFHYSHHMADIVSCTQAELARGTAAHAAETAGRMKSLMTDGK
jgi:phasin family protein